MRLNFWQWLGVVLILIGIAWWLYTRRTPTAAPRPAVETPAATTPAPTPTTIPTTAPAP